MNSVIPTTRCLPLFGAALAIAIAGCSSAPLRQSTSEMAGSTSSAFAAQPQAKIVLPSPVAGNPAPVYPEAMRRVEANGLVEVDCVVDEAGRVMVAHVVKTNDIAFSKAALEAVRSWKFTPGTRDGTPVAMHVIVPVSFAMDNK